MPENIRTKSVTKPMMILILAIFVASIFAMPLATHRASAASIAAAAAATPLTPDEANWQYVNHDAQGTNFSPQTQINAGNVASLQVNWIFPFPDSTAAPPGMKGVSYTAGSLTPPLVVNGIVYVMTNTMILYALSAKDGSTLWTHLYPLNYSLALKTVPIYAFGEHLHGLNFLNIPSISPNGVITYTGMACDINGVDALTGKQVFAYQNLCANIPGNLPGDIYRGWQSNHPPEIYTGKGSGPNGILITALAGGADALGQGAGRAFMTGLDAKTGAVVWRTFSMPPRDTPDSNFALQYCDHGWIQGIPCSQVTSNPTIKTIFQNDWINPKTGKIWFNSGTSGVWGFFPIDQQKGIVMMGTSQASPDYNASQRPGPNLYATTLFGLNATNGNVLWFFQGTTHDIWDYDCSWNGNLGTLTINGAPTTVYFKTCKNGYVYALDEMTGKPYWMVRAPGIAGGTYENLRDPLDPATYTLSWFGQLKPGDPIKPTITNGNGVAFIESDHAYDGKTIYVTSHNHPANFTMKCTEGKPGCVAPGGSGPDLKNLPHNATTSAIDAATGKVLWSFPLLGTTFRGGTTVSGGVVYIPAEDGYLYLLNAQTGKVIQTKYIGSAMDVTATLGATNDGTMQVYLNIGAGLAPGALIAFGLPAGGGPAASTTTVTSTAPGGGVTTITSTAPGGGVTTITSTAPGGGVSTITKTGGASTITVTNTGAGPSTGIDPNTLYAVSGVAIVAVIAAIFLGVRGRGKAGT